MKQLGICGGTLAIQVLGARAVCCDPQSYFCLPGKCEFTTGLLLIRWSW